MCRNRDDYLQIRVTLLFAVVDCVALAVFKPLFSVPRLDCLALLFTLFSCIFFVYLMGTGYNSLILFVVQR